MASNDSKIPSVLLFLAAYPFTKKINAIGISNLPAAVKSYRRAKSKELKHDAKRKTQACLLCLFHSSTVFSAVFGRYPKLITAHAIFGIGLSVMNSIDVRKEEEERARLEAEQQQQQQQQQKGPITSTNMSMTGRLRNWMFGPSTVEEDDDAAAVANIPEDADGDGNQTKPNKSRTVKAQKVVKRTKGILRGKRDSATDDIVWGTFQASFVLLDQAVGKALAYAWILFLLTVLEDALLNPKLSKEQRARRFLWVVAMGFVCSNLVRSDFGEFWLRLGRHALSFFSR